MASSNQLRNRACRLASDDPMGAAEIARSIREPWFRTQALAGVLCHIEEPRVDALVAEALASADGCEDAFKRAVVATSIIRALVDRGRSPQARTALNNALRVSDEIEHPGSRAEALRHLGRSTAVIEASQLRAIAERLVELSRGGKHWRVLRALIDILCELDAVDSEAASLVLARIPDEAWRMKVARRMGRDLDGD